MKATAIPLYHDPQSGDGAPRVELFLIDDREEHPVVIICPGGSYLRLALHREGGVGTAVERFHQLGFHCLVLHYRVAPFRYPAALEDAARAVRMVRSNRLAWRIKSRPITMLGFSAGGHLTASLGVHCGEMPEDRDFPGISCRPDRIILCCSVIHTHFGSFVHLLGSDAPSPKVETCKPHYYVNSSTVPTMLIHSADDLEAPVENALDFAAALSRHRVPFELHIFPRGGHGLGFSGNYPEMACWPELCAAWINGTER